jgi:hypothetical protein
MRGVRLCILILGLVVGREIAQAAESADVISQQSGPSGGNRRPSRTIGRLGMGVQLGGFYDLSDPALELRGWAKRLGFSVSLGRHYADPSEPEFTEVSSEAGKQFTGGLLFAFINPKAGRRVQVKVYATAGVVHTTQARGRWERVTPGRGGGTEGEAGVEGGTGTWPYAGAGAEIGFAGLSGLAVGSELLLAPLGDGGFGPGIRFAVRYYVW